MLVVNANKVFGISIFLLTSILVILVISIPSLSFLRVPLILAHIILFYLTILVFKKNIKIGFGLNLMLALVFYILIQNIYLSEDIIVVVQSIVMPLLVIITAQIARLNANFFYENEQYKTLAKLLLCIFPFFLISINIWSESRLSGLFMNPNITAHMAVMLLPFILLGVNTKKLKFLAIIFAFIIVAVTASRSGLMALTLGLSGFFIVNFFKKLGFFSLILLIGGAVSVSLYAVDIAISMVSQLHQYSASDSRLLYTGYNGRDILMDLAFERFKNQPWFGMGFDGAKFDLYGDGSELGTHNGLMDLLLRMGIIGSILFFIYSLHLIYLTSKNNFKFKPIATMSLICIFSLSTNSSTFFVFNYLFLYTIILVYVGYEVSSKPKNEL